MKKVFGFAVPALALAVLVVLAGFIVAGKVAWVSKVEYVATSSEFSGGARCVATTYSGVGVQRTVVKGYVPLGGSSGASGGFVNAVDYGVPTHPLVTQEVRWGQVSHYGISTEDSSTMVANACLVDGPKS